ncbi:MAG: hypothetical protein OJF55_001594 [Rhodanobacteraceae bacterium]|jgi:hypothetical protein|nr:MAG: hypothetical protein OJF55_001594 [Rhodanobacteraceae bacterium]
MKTSLYTILCIAIRLGAVLLAMGIVVALPNLYFVAHTAGVSSDTVPLMGLIYLVGLLAAFLLWVYPAVLARLAAGKSAEQIFESPIDARTIQYVALSVLGVSFALKGLIELVFEVFRLATLASGVPPGANLLPSELPRLASNVAEILLGIALMLGAKGLTTLLQRLRYGNQSWEEQV